MKSIIQFAHRRPIAFLLILSLALRFLAILFLDTKTGLLELNFGSAAAGEQADMARGLLQSGDFTFFKTPSGPAPSAYQPPLYPALLAGVFSMVGDGKAAYVIVQVVQALLGGLAVVMLYWLARRMLIEKYALLTACIAAVWPAFVYMPNEAHPIAFLVPIILWIVLLTIDIGRSPTRRSLYLWLALAFSLGLLVRSEMIVALFFTAAILLWQHRKRAVPGLALTLIICLIVQGAWMLRNAQALGKPVLTTTTGVNLYRGLGPEATGGSYQWNGEIAWDTPDTVAARRALPYSKDYELKVDQIYMDATKRTLAADPLRPIKLLPAKTLFYWTSDFTHPKGKLPIAWLPWMLLLPATLYGMATMLKHRRTTWPLYLWTMMYFAIVLVLFALPRYRLNVEALFLIFAVAGIGAFRARRGAPTPFVETVEQKEA